MTKVGFSTTNGIPSRLVRWFTRSRVSHSFLLVELEGKERVIQADWNGVVVTPWDLYQKQNQVVELLEVDQIKASDALDMADTPYDYEGFLGMAWVAFGRWFKRKWHNPLHSSHALFCSEMIVLLLQKANYPNASTLDAPSTSPQDLWDFLVTWFPPSNLESLFNKEKS